MSGAFDQMKLTSTKIQDEQSISIFSQQLRPVSKSNDENAAEASAEAKQEPMGDGELLLADCCVALCIDTEEENFWDCSSPLITVGIAFFCVFHVKSDWNCFGFRTT
jgi:hypothetical protein